MSGRIPIVLRFDLDPLHFLIRELYFILECLDSLFALSDLCLQLGELFFGLFGCLLELGA